MTSSVDYADKITKLLQKAESTTPDEAEALREKAFALMAKFQVDQAEIDARRDKNTDPHAGEEIVRDEVKITGVHRFAIMRLVNNVVLSYGTTNGYVVTNAYDHEKKKKKLAVEFWIVGFESDVKQVSLLVNSLMMQAASEMTQWWKSYRDKNFLTRYEKHTAKNDFFIAFGVAAAEKIHAARKNALRESTGTGAELVLVDKKTRVDQHLQSILGNSRESKAGSPRNGRNHDAVSAGWQAGKKANTVGTAINNTKQELE